MAPASPRRSFPAPQRRLFSSTPRSTKSPPRSPSAPKRSPFRATETSSMRVRALPGHRLSQFSTDAQCSPSARLPTHPSKACIPKSKKATKPSSFSELPIAASASSTPRSPARFLHRFLRLHLRPLLSRRRDHSPGAPQHFSPGKISNRPPKSNLASSSPLPQPSALVRCKPPPRRALRTVLSTSLRFSPAVGSLSRQTPSVTARKFWKFSPTRDQKGEATQFKSIATVSAPMPHRSPLRVPALPPPSKNRRTVLPPRHRPPLT